VELLLVDDDRVLLETAKDTLSSLGAAAETVSDGEEAVKLASKRHQDGRDYDVVIVDWKMPGMDGVEVVRRMREVTGDEVPILLVSAYDWSDIEEAAHRAGANGFISKPLFRSTLYEKISELLGRQTKELQEESNADLADMRILVAEDNDINWEVVSMLLQMSGITCTRARNGAEAVDIMRGTGRDDFDMIFMDIQMPVMNGLEATKTIRALDDKKAASIPIIAMTADAFSENVAECFAVGMNGHVAKPIDIKHVLKEIRKVKEAKHDETR
jgi:CheY-like chemotaxis protein